MTGDDWALVVGIDAYPKAGVDPLEGAVSDAERFHAWVTRADGGGVDPANALLLTAQVTAPPGPVFSHFFDFFLQLRDRLEEQPGRRLYVFLSGHGISPTGQQSVRNAALLLASAKKPRLWDNFAGNLWAEGIRSAALFRQVVLIMDCCRDLENNATIIPHIFGDPVLDSRDCLLVEAYATAWASKARELPFPPDNQKQGVFTHSLLAVLEAGRISGSLLKASVQAHLAWTLADERKSQETEIKGNPDEGVLEQIIFNEQAAEPSTPVQILGHPANPPAIRFWPEGADVAERVPLDGWALRDGVWEGVLAPGQYEVDLPNGRQKRLKVLAAVPASLEVQP